MMISACLGAVVLASGTARARRRERFPQTLEMCTDRGPLVGTLDEDGSFTGLLSATWSVAGTPERLVISRQDQGDTVLLWKGALEELRPRSVKLDPAAYAQAFAELVPEWRARGDRVVGAGFRGRVDEDGILRGRRRRVHYSYALSVDRRSLYGGQAPPSAKRNELPGVLAVEGEDEQPVDELVQRFPASREEILESLLEAHLHSLGWLRGCELGGDEQFYVGRFRYPQPLADESRLVSTTANSALVRGPAGATWYLDVHADPALAASILADLRPIWPEARTEVAHDGERALLMISYGAQALVGELLEPTERPPGVPTVAPFLRVHPALVEDYETEFEVFRSLPATGLAGLEQWARLNALREDAGLELLEWSPLLHFSAGLHCAWLDGDLARGGTGQGHRQTPGSPLFVGEWPVDRWGAGEVVARSDRSPERAVDSWVSTPFHRYGPMHPLASAAGGCGGAPSSRVMEIDLDWDQHTPAVTIYPIDGATDVPRVFSGRETPDPVPIERYPDKTLPFGYTLSAWFAELPSRGEVVSSSVTREDGTEVEHYVVRYSEIKPDTRWYGEEAVHLIPMSPLASGATYQWSLEYESEDVTRRAEGVFTTEREPEGVAIMEDPALEAWVEAINDVRTRAEMERLTPSARAGAAALLHASSDGFDSLRQPLPDARVMGSCQAWDNLSLWHQQGRLSEVVSSWADPQLSLVGGVVWGERACLVASSDPFSSWQTP